MRRIAVLLLLCLAIFSGLLLPEVNANSLNRRQASSATNTATITSNDGGSSTVAPSNGNAPTLPPSGQPVSEGSAAATSGQSSATPAPSSNSTSSHTTSHTTNATTTHLPPPTHTASNSTGAIKHNKSQELPLKPRITPALSFGGVILIITGVAYALIGVKNKWIQIFLSTAYLTSLSIAVLIDYVMSPPISDAIQGAYFVGIFMTGVIFGAGALIFKEVTEGLGCLFGGFCLGMWFLTLKSGGLIENQAGRGILIAVFSLVVWSLSFSHYTRAYALIGSTSFGGSTAFVLGIDCFSRAGLKEFWFYIWNLNDNLFPLGTTTYPITRGIRVEIIVIVLGCIVGVMSQIKLWKILRDKQRKRDLVRLEDDRRRDVVEEALGRHIERQNDKDRVNWEKQYGDRLNQKRSTILWSEAHPDKSYTHIATAELAGSHRSSSSETVEMSTVGSKKVSAYGSRKGQRASATTVEAIPEESEDTEARASMERLKALTALESQKRSPKPESMKESVSSPKVEPEASPKAGPEVIPLPFKVPTSENNSKTDVSTAAGSKDPNMLQEPKRASKRRSLQSLLSISPRLSSEKPPVSESQEALVLPDPLHSRPSSIAATIDDDNDRAEIYAALTKIPSNEPHTPKITISPAGSYENLQKETLEKDTMPDLTQPSSPSASSVNFEFEDPEELSRPVEPKEKSKQSLAVEAKDKRISRETKRTSTSDGDALASSDSYARSQASTVPTSTADGLTKGALDQVPSQMSNVVMSYRTNEWAKHISVADEPMFDEPENIASDESEPPTHIAPPTPPSPAKSTPDATTESPTSKLPSLTASSKPPPPHVISSMPEGNVTANVKPPKRSKTDEGISTSAPAPVVAPSRSTSVQSTQSARPALAKMRSGTLNRTNAMTPIDENIATDAGSDGKSARRSSIGVPSIVMNAAQAVAPVRSNSVLQSMSQPQWHSSTPNLLRSSSYSSLPDSNPDWSQRSSGVLMNRPAMRSATRLDSYDSRQPQQRDTNKEALKRENLLAEWRMSQQQGAVHHHVPAVNVEQRRQQMLLDKEHKKMMEEQQKVAHQQKQFAIDQVMRRPDMQDLHREAMRKMQAGASKKM